MSPNDDGSADERADGPDEEHSGTDRAPADAGDVEPAEGLDPDDVEPEDLLAHAREASERAVAPYSGYRVGAAVATPEGAFVGCNLEVANYSNSLHAEEVALGSALAAGTRTFRALAVSTAARDGATPCGACRQTLWEFCPPELPILCDEGESYATYTLEDLLPAAFSLADANGD